MSENSIAAAYTAGPWHGMRDGKFAETPWCAELEDESTCSAPIVDDSGQVIALVVSTDMENHDEIKANARLIAAAPELLESLRMLTAALPVNRDWLDPDIERFAKSIIARATGVQP